MLKLSPLLYLCMPATSSFGLNIWSARLLIYPFQFYVPVSLRRLEVSVAAYGCLVTTVGNILDVLVIDSQNLLLDLREE